MKEVCILHQAAAPSAVAEIWPQIRPQPRSWPLASEPQLRPYKLVWVLKPTMLQPTKKVGPPSDLEGNEEPHMPASAKALANLSSQTQTEDAPATLTPRSGGGCGFFCQPWCLLLALTLLLLCLLGSWAVVHLSLETHGGSPFRVSASYDQHFPQDDTATIEPHFTTNCTIGKSEPSLYIICSVYVSTVWTVWSPVKQN